MAPLVFTLGAVTVQLHQRPTGRQPLSVVGVATDDPLHAGAQWQVALPPTHRPVRAVALWVRSQAPGAELEARLCSGDRCQHAAARVGDPSALTIPVPDDVSRPLLLTVVRVSNGVRFRSAPGAPIEVVEGYSWALPFRQARAYAHELAGRDVLPVALVAWGAALLGLMVAALILSWRPAPPTETPPTAGSASTGARMAPLPRARCERGEWLGLALLTAIFAARVVILHWDFVPFWDGRIYGQCLLDYQLLCVRHPTLAYFGFLELARALAPSRYGGVLIGNAALGCAALVAFHDLLRSLRPGGGGATARLAAVAALSTHPVVLASAVNLTPDYGVLVFFVGTLWALVRDRPALTALFGVGLAMSKEPGIGFYALALGAHTAFLVPPRGWAAHLRRSLRHPELALPVLAVGAFVAYQARSAGMWTGGTFSWGLNPQQALSLAWMLLGGFQWVALATILGLLVLVGMRLVRGRYPSPPVRFSIALLAAGAFMLSRYVTFTNPRYYVVLAPALVLAAWTACGELPWPRALGTAWIGLTAGLLAWASVRTADPVMTRLLGTFPFGEHSLLDTTSFTGECCGRGRDQLAYNLEFVRLHALQDMVYPVLRSAPGVPIVAHAEADFFLSGPLDRGNRRTWIGGEPFGLVQPLELLARPSPRAFYLRFPNFDDAQVLALLSASYSVTGSRTFSSNGYAIEVLTLDQRARAP